MMFQLDYASELLPILLKASLVTLAATLGGMALALVLGLALALLRRSPHAVLRRPASMFVEFVRSTPLLIQIFFIYYVLPLYGVRIPTVACGIVALGLHYATYTAEVYRAGIEAVPRGQWEAGRALSLPAYRIWRHIVLPQALPPVVPALGNYLIAMFKETPLLAVIGVHELLGTALQEASQTYRYYEPLTLVGLIFLAFSLVAALILRRVEVRLADRS
ncbi:ectoine/hydroxyectoine ABC transporter permease subunit EhuD [Ancylobacter sp. Lp-2]|uniref:ectoine/hydroxyectoine ABC transporter permease subunit EhuD n=1 Tax=Ancylobacter sp. Lp-2 TaxID=2881339 RepID=UPI001E52A7BA|nr:ectoine/hydroxyectoine ABC transporter permease subunit EhuD [Ancylobacter sp. Lp-2]MCB4768470.1 ectoine/hydroxyectoine ABC transporter permease subunit EhuD [Ancylobacter sp. Lp-2]